jgi:UDPglucose--hexose-1-phosphate uridylyltransferase
VANKIPGEASFAWEALTTSGLSQVYEFHRERGLMELRRDPITQSWVIQQTVETSWATGGVCPLCPGNEYLCPPNLYVYPYGASNWQVRVIPHRNPIYQIEGDPARRAEGIYDKMRNIGAHEVVIENPDHHLPWAQLSDDQAIQALRAYATRITDLKKDLRFRCVTLFQNVGPESGQDLEHPHSEITATPFIPRRLAYELRAGQAHYQQKERCLFCDIVKQEMDQQVRAVVWNELFLAFCPFASRVPYETWIVPIYHHASFEDDVTSSGKQQQLGRLMKSALRRLLTVAKAYHLVLHTSPNVNARPSRPDAWQTLADDYHWHFEILPIIPGKSKSYSFKEVYFNTPPPPEIAAKDLRDAEPALS